VNGAIGPDGVYVHTPGALSPRGVLDVGIKCPHSCRFCYYSFWDKSQDQFAALRRAEFRSGADCKAIMEGFASQGLGFADITGGEPAMHPDIADIVRHGSERGVRSRIITLGQLLTGRDNLLERLLEAGLADALFSMHAVEEARFKDYTGGSWQRLRSVLDTLDSRDFPYGANTVIFEGNKDHLADIALESTRRAVYVHNFIIFNAYHEWNTASRVAGVQARFSDVAPAVEKAVAILDGAGIAVNLRYVPLCVFPGLERHVVGVLGLPYDPFEWRNRACNPDKSPEYCSTVIPIPETGVREQFALIRQGGRTASGVEYVARRGESFKYFPPACAGCAAMEACDGMDSKYLKLNGDGDLRPFAKAELAGPLMKARLDYVRAHRVKAVQFGSAVRPGISPAMK